MNNNKIKKIFKEKLNLENIEIKKEESGIHSTVKIVKAGDKKYVIKIPIWDVKIFRENFAYKKLYKLIPMPKTFVMDKDYIIQEYIEGNSLDKINLTKKQTQFIFTQLGKIIRNLHKIKTKGAGFIEKDGKGSHNSFEEFVNSWLNKNLKIIKKTNLINKNKFLKLENYLEKNKEFYNTKDNRLLHYDLEEWNIKIKNNKIMGIIDFGDLFSGPIEWDFVRPYLTNHSNKKFDFLIKGYGKEIDLEKLKYYAVLEIIFTFPYNYENNKKKLKYHLEFLNDLFKNL